MNTVELNFNALVAASTALLGAEKTNMLSELYVLLDNAEKIGEVSGYERGVDEKAAGFEGLFEEGYAAGVDDGIAHGGIAEAQREDAYNDGYEQGANDYVAYSDRNMFVEGFDEGYEQAREDLGECPIVDQDWDRNDEYGFN